MSLSKKQRLSNVIDYEYEYSYILKFVGNVAECRGVSRHFIPKDYVTRVKFNAQTPIQMIFRILTQRSTLKIVDFTGSHRMNESILHVVMMIHPSLYLIVLDRCERFDEFPSFSDEDEINMIQLSHKSTMKWRNTISPVLSFKGCWKLFRFYHHQNPLCITNIVMCALNNGCDAALEKIQEFCVDRTDWVTRISRGSLVNQLKSRHDWRIIISESFIDRGYVLMDVNDFSLVVWVFFRKAVRGKNVWCLLGIWKASIYKMWKLCKLSSQM